jgi:hypothetical protein
VPQANRKPRRGAELVGVAKRPASAIGGHHDDRAEYRVAFRKKVYRSIDELQVDLDSWIKEYNEARPHQGRWCFGKTPMQTFLDAIPVTKEKMIAA